MEETNKDFFELKYLEEISELFTQLKEINNYYGLNLFKNNNYIDLFEFINNHVIICENDFLSEDEIDNEENKSINNIYGKF